MACEHDREVWNTEAGFVSARGKLPGGGGVSWGLQELARQRQMLMVVRTLQAKDLSGDEDVRLRIRKKTHRRDSGGG